jgi:hypothetical protein
LFKVNLFRNFSITWLYKHRLNILVQETPTGDNVKEEWRFLQNILKQAALDSLRLKRKWNRKKGVRLWEEYIGKVVNNKREAFRRFLSRNKLEDKIDCHRKRAIIKHEVHKKLRKSWERFVSQMENYITRPQPQTYNIIKQIRQ